MSRPPMEPVPDGTSVGRAVGTPAPGSTTSATSGRRRPDQHLYALLAMTAGLLAIVGVYWLTMSFSRDGNALAFFGAAASPIVAIVSAFFGIQASARSAEDAHATSQRLAETIQQR